MHSNASLMRSLFFGLILAGASEAQQFGGATIGDLTPTNIASPHPYPPSGDISVPVWTHRVSMPAASYLRLHTRMDLGTGDFLVVRDSDGVERWRYTNKGPVTSHMLGLTPDDDGVQLIPGLGQEFHTDTVFDDTITLELFAQTGGFGVQVSVIEHGYPWAVLRGITSPETPCTLTPPFLDFECETQAQRVANGNAVCGLATSGVFCSGTLISNQSHVLTANHCVSSQAGANTTNLWFRFQELCGTGTLRGTVVVPSPQTFVTGQASGPGPDYTVLRANGTPHTTFGFARLEARDPATNESLYIIGHPSGRPKEITYGPARGVIGFTGNTHFQHRADTEGGNSGSGVFSEVSHCIVGVHTNGGCTIGNATSGNWASRMSQDFAAIQAAVPGVAVCGQGGGSGAPCHINEVVPSAYTTVAANSSSGFPWGSSAARRTLYSYGGSVLGFNQAVRFSGIEFRPQEGVASSVAGSYDFALYVSTGRNNARALDYTFANNHGADLVKVFDGVLAVPAATLGATPNDFILKVPFSVPFEWDPSCGPLLVDIQYRSGTVATGTWDGPFNTGEECGRISLSGSANGAVANFPGGAGNPTQNFALVARLCLDCDTVPDAYAGSEANSSSGFPWNAGGAQRVMYAYDPSLMNFSDRQRITRLGWRPDNGNAFGGATYDVRISLSTGTNPANALNATFNNNHGADRLVVFDGLWTAPAAPSSTAPNGFALSIELQRAFDYNPALGPLVVDLQMRGITGTPGTSFDGPFNTAEIVGRIAHTTDPNAAVATFNGGLTQAFALTLGVCGEPCPTVPAASDNAFGSSSAFPWGGTQAMRAQYVYDSATVGSDEPIYIQHIRWRPLSSAPSIGPVSYDLRIDLSTSGLATASALTTTFNSNHGPNRARVFDGRFSVPLTALSGNPRDFPIKVKLDTPFYWNPAHGPLVIDLMYRGASGSGLVACDGPFNTAPAYRVVHQTDPNGAVATFGPQQFAYAVSLCGVNCNGLAVNYGTACAGSGGLPINTTVGLPVIPNPSFAYRLSSGPAGSPAALWIGIGQVSIDLTGLGATGCFLLNTVDLAAITTATNGSGEAIVPSPIPFDPLISGLTVYTQWIALDPSAPRPLGVVTSDGQRITLCF